jgi:hypothetical protein
MLDRPQSMKREGSDKLLPFKAYSRSALALWKLPDFIILVAVAWSLFTYVNW